MRRWRQLRFEINTFGDVVQDDEPPDDLESSSDQRSDCDVCYARISGESLKAEFIEVVNAGVVAHAVILFEETRWEQLREPARERQVTRRRVHDLHLRIP